MRQPWYQLRLIDRIVIWDLFVSVAEGAALFSFVFLLRRLYYLTELIVGQGASLFEHPANSIRHSSIDHGINASNGVVIGKLNGIREDGERQ